MLQYDRHLKNFSRRLRTGMTDAEQRLWYRVRRKQLAGVQCYRQKPIGPYIVDFYAPAARLVIELDGSQHFTVDGVASDRIRDAYLRRVGLEVMRFDDRQVLLQTDAVIEIILQAILARS